MKHIQTVITACLILLSASALKAQDASTVVARVNGQDITLGHLIVLRNALPASVNQYPSEVLYNLILDQIIDQTVLQQSLDTDLETRHKLRLENEERALAAQQIVDRISAEPISDAELNVIYDRLYPETTPELEYNASHILVETEEAAKGLLNQLETDADFADLARTHSTGPSGANGGQLGWFSATDMVPEFSEAVIALSPDEISNPVQTQFGWHLVKLHETREKTRPSLDQVRAEVEDNARQDKISQHIEKLSSSAEITRLELENFDPKLIEDSSLIE